MKLSEISGTYEVREQVSNALYFSSDTYAVIGDTTAQIEGAEPEYFLFASDGSVGYFMTNLSDESVTGDLYKFEIKGTQVTTQLYDADVCASGSTP